MHQIALVLLAVVGRGLSQVVVNGTCPFKNLPLGNISTVYGTLSELKGTWYQVERIANPEESGDCATTWFNDDMAAISNREIVHHTAVVNNGTITREPRDSRDNYGWSMFNVTFPGHGPRSYYVLTTDYHSYAFIAICEDATVYNVNITRVYASKLSRNKSLTANAKKEFKNAITEYFAKNPALVNVTWRATDFSKEACRSAGCFWFGFL